MTIGRAWTTVFGMRLTRIVRAAASRPKTTVALWLLFVVACTMAGGIAGTKTLSDSDSDVGESAVADQRLKDAGLREHAAERVLVRSSRAATTHRTADVLTQRLKRLPEVATASSGGTKRSDELVVVTLRGDPEDAADHVAPIERTVRAVAAEHPARRCSRPATARARTRSTTSSTPTCRRPSASPCRSRSSCC